MKKLHLSLTDIRTQLFIGKLTLAAVVVLSMIGQVNAQGSGTSAPEIIDFSFTPSTIDTTDSSQTVTVTIRAKNAGEIGVDFVPEGGFPRGLYTVSPFMNLISGDSKDGIYRGVGVFPKHSKAGTWNVHSIYVIKDYHFFYHFFASALAARGFATQLQVVSNNEDVTPPEIIDFSITPSIIDFTTSSQQATVTIRATDVKAGVHHVSVFFSHPPNPNFSGSSNPIYLDSRNRISGDDKDGVYRGFTTFSTNSASMIYDISVFAIDTLGNLKSLNTGELVARGFVSQLQVITPNVLISGRVLDTNNRSVSKAVITLTSSDGSVKYATTNSVGYYRFNEVKVGIVYNFKVKHKRYNFAPKVLPIFKENNSLNFVATEQSFLQMK